MAIRPSEWGPSLWKILHTLAEFSSIQDSVHDEENAAWQTVVRLLPRIMPCPRCSKHFQQWLEMKPLSGILEKNGAEKREGLRLWFLECHNRVNLQNGKAELEAEKLQELYPLVRLDDVFKSLTEVLRKGQERGSVQFEDVYRWKCAIGVLRRLSSC